MPSSSSSVLVNVVAKSTIFPEQKSDLKPLKLSVSDLPMLSCQYIQKGVLLSHPPHYSIDHLLCRLKRSLSLTLTHFPALAGRLSTDPDGHIHIVCNDEGVDFIHAKAKHLSVHNLLYPDYVPADCFKEFFPFDRTISYSGHFKPLAAVQVTELNDALFISCTVNHAATDGTSFWHFFNTFAEICRGAKKISKRPCFCRNTMFDSPAVLKFPPGGPKVTFSGDVPLRERIFHFSREAILKLKLRANDYNQLQTVVHNNVVDQSAMELLGKLCNDGWKTVNEDNDVSNCKITSVHEGWLRNNVSHRTTVISSFQSLCAQLWRSVTRARKLTASKTTTFRMAVNCRHRVEPRLDQFYFGNAIQSIPTVAAAGELLSRDLSWCADLLHRNVFGHDDATVRGGIENWEKKPCVFPLGNFDGASMTMGSSPRFPMYDNDFGWGRPLAVRSGAANKFDGKISAFPGREGNGSVDLEVVLAAVTMAELETDMEFMQYVSSISTSV